MTFVLAGGARTLAEDRPLWVYAARPFIAAAVWSWAGAYHLRESWRRVVVSGMGEKPAVIHLRDRGLLAYHLGDFARALRDLEEYLKLARLSDQDEDQMKETEQVWEHVKTLRRRVAQLN